MRKFLTAFIPLLVSCLYYLHGNREQRVLYLVCTSGALGERKFNHWLYCHRTDRSRKPTRMQPIDSRSIRGRSWRSSLILLMVKAEAMNMLLKVIPLASWPCDTDIDTVCWPISGLLATLYITHPTYVAYCLNCSSSRILSISSCLRHTVAVRLPLLSLGIKYTRPGHGFTFGRLAASGTPSNEPKDT